MNTVRKISCTIYTVIQVSDQNGNVLSEETYKIIGSGLQCIGAKDGIVRKVKRLSLEGVNL